ncbi:MAG: 4-demethylwyosine synthase TYW1 [Nanoarchaeota archaeon]
MLSPEAKQELERQQYRIIGSHSAVKVCGWTKKMIKGEGGCYKFTFYGIKSNQCLQMTTSMSCANRCTFCWRGYKAPVAKEWSWDADDPQMILEGSLKAQFDLLAGLKGYAKVNKQMYKESNDVKHVALSLTGEPIIYPKINELLQLFNKKGISTFMVTNAQYPEAIRTLAPVTQLYISLDAPNEKLLKEVDVPLFKDYWPRLLESLDAMKEKKQRTCIRLTCIKDVNMIEPDEYAKLIRRANPDFIECKGYMFVGASRQRLSIKNMPYHEEVLAFAKQIEAALTDYEIAGEHTMSRAVMLAKKTFKKKGAWHTWIDFPKWQELALKGDDFSTKDYLTIMPKPFVFDLNKPRPKKEVVDEEL